MRIKTSLLQALPMSKWPRKKSGMLQKIRICWFTSLRICCRALVSGWLGLGHLRPLVRRWIGRLLAGCREVVWGAREAPPCSLGQIWDSLWLRMRRTYSRELFGRPPAETRLHADPRKVPRKFEKLYCEWAEIIIIWNAKFYCGGGQNDNYSQRQWVHTV